MPNMKNRSRLVTMLAVAALGIATMSPAMAAKPDQTPPAQAENARVNSEAVGAENAAIGQEKAAAGQAIAAEREQFATVTVQKIVADFVLAVQDWTACINENASSNEENAETSAINPYDVCGPLGVDQSPGHFVSALHIE